MKRSSIDSLIKFPLLLPSESSQSQAEVDDKKPNIKNTNRNETREDNEEDPNPNLKLDSLRLANGYIKYPKYDFF